MADAPAARTTDQRTHTTNHLRLVDRLVVDIAIDNLSDSYSSKPAHISAEFSNIMAAGATEILGTDAVLCAAWSGAGPDR